MVTRSRFSLDLIEFGKKQKNTLFGLAAAYIEFSLLMSVWVALKQCLSVCASVWLQARLTLLIIVGSLIYICLQDG